MILEGKLHQISKREKERERRISCLGEGLVRRKIWRLLKDKCHNCVHTLVSRFDFILFSVHFYFSFILGIICILGVHIGGHTLDC